MQQPSSAANMRYKVSQSVHTYIIYKLCFVHYKCCMAPWNSLKSINQEKNLQKNHPRVPFHTSENFTTTTVIVPLIVGTYQSRLLFSYYVNIIITSTSDLQPSAAIGNRLPGQLVSTQIRTRGHKLELEGQIVLNSS